MFSVFHSEKLKTNTILVNNKIPKHLSFETIFIGFDEIMLSIKLV